MRRCEVCLSQFLHIRMLSAHLAFLFHEPVSDPSTRKYRQRFGPRGGRRVHRGAAIPAPLREYGLERGSRAHDSDQSPPESEVLSSGCWVAALWSFGSRDSLLRNRMVCTIFIAGTAP